jgi:nitronate monooxygenase
MAGGPSTPALTAAVADAGAYGFVAGGYLTAGELREAVSATRRLSGAPFGVNLFVPSSPGDPAGVAAYAARLQPEADRLGVALGEPRWDDDAYGAKLEVLEDTRVHMAGFTFGCPAPGAVEALHRVGTTVAVTVTSVPEARLAADAGADVLLVQGTEAGGHQGSFADLAVNHTPLLTALAEIAAAVDLPLVAGGGIMTADDAAAAHGAGAVAVQVGTALLCAPEAGTSAVYRRALLEARYDDTVVTRAFSGRFARGLANRFAREHTAHAPQAYPEVHHLTRPLRAAATRAGDADVPNLWAGTGWHRIAAEPAATVVRRIADGFRRPGG